MWELPWKHLSIANLGQGQLQIKSMKKFLSDKDNTSKLTKDEWYQEFINQGKLFYDNLELITRERGKAWVC